MQKFRIIPKRDFGSTGFLIKGKIVKRGFVVTDGMCNVMPGGTWFQTIPEALFAITVLVVTHNNAELFWKVIHAHYRLKGELQ